MNDEDPVLIETSAIDNHNNPGALEPTELEDLIEFMEDPERLHSVGEQ